jgi:serine protease Do
VDPLVDPLPPPRTYPPARAESSSNFPWNSAIWSATALGALTILLLLLPKVVEQTFYAFHRAPEQAAADAARDALDNFDAQSFGSAFQLVAKRIAPSVVHINVNPRTRSTTRQRDFLFPGVPMRGQGSGVIVDEEGFIVTNEHVVEGDPDVEVLLSDGSKHTAEIVGTDDLYDLAVLRIRAERKLTAAEWGDSNLLEVGSFVWAVGSPFGLDHTVTFGIISAKQRSGTTAYQDFLQTDAAINPGNSGGPLVNVKGEIVGINTAIVGQNFAGVGFAIPSAQVKDVYQQLRNKGSIDRGWLGIQMIDITPEVAKRLELGDVRGVFVEGVLSDSPAQRAGVKAGDVVVQVNGQKVESRTALARAVAQLGIGSKAQLGLLRGERELTLEVEIGRRPRFPQ